MTRCTRSESSLAIPHPPRPAPATQMRCWTSGGNEVKDLPKLGRKPSARCSKTWYGGIRNNLEQANLRMVLSWYDQPSWYNGTLLIVSSGVLKSLTRVGLPVHLSDNCHAGGIKENSISWQVLLKQRTDNVHCSHLETVEHSYGSLLGWAPPVRCLQFWLPHVHVTLFRRHPKTWVRSSMPVSE